MPIQPSPPHRARRRPHPPQRSAAAPEAQAATPPGAATAPESGAPFGFLSPSWQNQNLLGDMGGLRPALSNHGITLTILENIETFGNLSGGVQQGFEADGLTTVTLQMDTEKAFGLKGGTFNVSGLQYWGGNLTVNNLLVLQTLTDIEAPGRRSTLGAVVSAEIRRQVRHQGRRTEPRRGIRHRPKRKLPLRQRGVRLARIANH